MPYYTRPSTTFGAGLGRSVTLRVPNAWDPAKTYPLILILHSYGASGTDIVDRFDLDEAVNFDDGCLILSPDGENDGVTSNKWWDYRTPFNASFAYPKLIVDEVCASGWKVDLNRVYIIGYSNGGFMAHQLVAYYPTRWTAIFTLAGARVTGAPVPSVPVAAFVVHGDGDTTVLPGGDPAGTTLPGSMGGTDYQSHASTVAAYDTANGGTGSLASAYDSIDWVTAVAGAETSRQKYNGHSPPKTVEKWTIVGGNHSFSFTERRGQDLFVLLERNHRGV